MFYFHYFFQRRGRPYGVSGDRHLIVTLDPNKFAEKKQRRLRVGGLQYISPPTVLHNQTNPVVGARLYYDRNKSTDAERYSPYPPDIKAFLYYFTSPEKPRIAGELRLRVTSSDDPESFGSGCDLLRSKGQPWSRPLYVLRNHYMTLYEKLREERLVQDDLDEVLSTFPRSWPRYNAGQQLYSMNDTFIIDFSICRPSFLVITEQGVDSVLITHWQPLFEDRRGAWMGSPYTGAYTNHHLSILLD